MNWQVLLEALATNHPELSNSGFAHIANVGKLEAEALYDFGNGLQIRKARPNEIVTLQSLVYLTRPLTPLIQTRNPYETQSHSKETKPGSVSYSTTDLPKDEWRYHVITFEGTNAKLHDFVDASVLTRSRLELGPMVFAMPGLKSPGFGGGTALGRLWEELAYSDEPFLTLNTTELDDLKLVYQKVGDIENNRVELRDTMKRFAQLDGISKSSPLRFLGYVSILESMITHAPDPKDPYDTLTRQVRQKMLLVGRRCLIPVPYEIFGTGTEPDTLWTRLYEYRSAIAHGATANFSGRLQCLKNPAAALDFISSATVAVMRQALEEPDLIADLRAC